MGTWRHSEAKTADREVFNFMAPPEKIEEIKGAIALVRQLDSPKACRVTTEHGSYGRCTRYDIMQHEYAGGGHPGSGGFIEVLEIENPPDGKCGIVIYEYRSSAYGSKQWFSEWKTLKGAIAAFKKHWGSSKTEKELPEMPGFIRLVECGALDPWFYAVGSQELVGDFAFPENIQDDSVYRFGQKFVVFDSDGFPSVKTCMGTRHIRYKSENSMFSDRSDLERTHAYRIVYWSDGTCWDEGHDRVKPPKPLLEGEIWVVDAVEKFYEFLSGGTTGFTVDFIDGSQFVGTHKKANKKAMTVEGQYYAEIVFKDGRKNKGVFEFTPTPETPDALSFLESTFSKQGATMEQVEITRQETKAGGKKWSGVFYNKVTDTDETTEQSA